MTQDSPVTKGGKDYENHKYIRGWQKLKQLNMDRTTA
jgi:hypothetical protein